MSKPLSYKGYSARIEFDAEDLIFVGSVAGIGDIVSFHGDTVANLVSAFEEAVDHYLAASDELGRPAQKPASGKLMLRVPPDVHAAAVTAADAAGKSMNQWAAEALAQAAHV